MAEHLKAEIIEDEDTFLEFAKSEKTKAAISAIVIMVVNLVVYFFGVTLDANMIADGVMAVILIAATGYAIWKNHNFTEAAALGQQVLDTVKASEKAETESEVK